MTGNIFIWFFRERKKYVIYWDPGFYHILSFMKYTSYCHFKKRVPKIGSTVLECTYM